MKRFFGFVVVCLMLGTVAVFAEMQCPVDGMKHKSKDGMMRNKGMKNKKGKMDEGLNNVKRYLKLKGELELTDVQVKALEKIQLDYKKDNIKRQADIKIICVDLAEVLRKDAPDFEAARSNIKKVSALQLDSKLATIDGREKAYKVLTEKQREKLSQLKKERKEKWMKEKKGKRNKQ